MKACPRSSPDLTQDWLLERLVGEIQIRDEIAGANLVQGHEAQSWRLLALNARFAFLVSRGPARMRLDLVELLNLGGGSTDTAGADVDAATAANARQNRGHSESSKRKPLESSGCLGLVASFAQVAAVCVANDAVVAGVILMYKVRPRSKGQVVAQNVHSCRTSERRAQQSTQRRK